MTLAELLWPVVVYHNYLEIEVSKDEVINTIKCEDAQCTYLPGM